VTEAQILGKPIIITNYPTAGSQIENGVSGVICGLSVEEIAEEIERLYSDTALRNNLVNNCLQTDYSNTNELNKLYNIVNVPKQNYVMKEVTV
ncbi:glycosyltransferase, partial [Paenibacillus sp. TAF58]